MSRHRNVSLVCLSFAFIALFVSLAPAQQGTKRVTSVALPSPQSVLGFAPGDDRKIADWSQIRDYFARLDKASDRVLVEQIGESSLKHPMIAAFISARENILALKKYKEIQRKLADPRTIATKSEYERLLASGKVIVAISCSIHSTEIIASQMSMQLAYDLSSATDTDTREILQNTILILIPSANPDGVDIVAEWYRKTLGTPFEGKEPPELYHHYAGHDDNRDWFMLNLKETKAITRLFWKEWFPEIVYDVHQQGSNGSRFFVPPFFDPPNPNIDPLLLREVALAGHKMAADLQAAGFKGVITNSLYDTWWHGGFRTAPYFHNSIGLLTEAASAKLMSPTRVTAEELARSATRGMRSALEQTTNFPDPWPGGEWHPRDIMSLELVAARSLLSLAAKFRSHYLQNFVQLGKKSVDTPIEPDEGLAYLIPAGQGRDEAVAKLVGTLVEQGIELFRLDKEIHAVYGPVLLQRTNSVSEKLGTYRKLIAATTGIHEVPAGSYIVFVAQPQRSNIRALFEPQTYPNRVNPQGEAERPYDVAGWTLPMQLGVDAPVVTAIQESAAERRLTLITDPIQVRRDLALSLPKQDESPIVNPIKQAVRLGVYKGWTPNMDEGWTRYILDTFNVPYKSVRDAEMRQGNLLSSYDVIILPSQRAQDIVDGNSVQNYPQEYTGGITTSGVTSLKNFVADGGTLICFDASCGLAIKELDLPLRNVLENSRSSDFYCPGSILSLDVDNTNPLSRGMTRTADGYFINSSAFEATGDGVKVAARYAKDGVLRSGWLLGEDKIRGKIALAQVSVGKGRVILFAFRPQHRGQSWGTLPFIWNAIMGGHN